MPEHSRLTWLEVRVTELEDTIRALEVVCLRLEQLETRLALAVRPQLIVYEDNATSE